MTLIYFLIVIGILVFVHEFGHFIMAKAAGVRVEKFSLGFGPKLVGYKKGDTEYMISALPLGGYVKMAGENPDEEPTGARDEFQAKPVWQRVIIAVTGPVTNIVLAFALMPAVFFIGAKVPAYLDEPARIGWVETGSAAYKAGFERGDLIQEMKSRDVDNWTKALSIIAANPNTELDVRVKRAGLEKTLRLIPEADPRTGVGEAGLLPEIPPIIGSVSPGMPAEKAGLKPGDTILSVNGSPVVHWIQFSQAIRQNVGKEITINVKRDNEVLSVVVTPEKSETLGYGIIGVAQDLKTVTKRFGVAESIKKGFSNTMDLFGLTIDVLKRLFSFKLSIKSLGGPIMIAQLSGQAAQSGLADFLRLMSFISLQLGILNLLPIPVLDGGLVLFLIIEAVRKKPLSRRAMEIAQSIGFAALITLFAIISYNDVMRLFVK